MLSRIIGNYFKMLLTVGHAECVAGLGEAIHDN